METVIAGGSSPSYNIALVVILENHFPHTNLTSSSIKQVQCLEYSRHSAYIYEIKCNNISISTLVGNNTTSTLATFCTEVGLLVYLTKLREGQRWISFKEWLQDSNTIRAL